MATDDVRAIKLKANPQSARESSDLRFNYPQATTSLSLVE